MLRPIILHALPNSKYYVLSGWNQGRIIKESENNLFITILPIENQIRNHRIYSLTQSKIV